jgi:hypothetical protein
MRELRYTLLSDGSSDRALMPLLTWLLRQYLTADVAIQPAWADLFRLPRPPRDLSERILVALDLYPCDLLWVHRDAEREPREKRVEEIRKAVTQAACRADATLVCVVPVRMQEAWLLINEAAIRRAAGNPNGRNSLALPRSRDLEDLPDPKDMLHELLREASGLQGRRRARFSAPGNAWRVAEFIEDFTPLRILPAFRALEDELAQALRAIAGGSYLPD